MIGIFHLLVPGRGCLTSGGLRYSPIKDRYFWVGRVPGSQRVSVGNEGPYDRGETWCEVPPVTCRDSRFGGSVNYLLEGYRVFGC